MPRATHYEPGQLIMSLTYHDTSRFAAHQLWLILADEGDDTYQVCEMTPPLDSKGEPEWGKTWTPDAHAYRVRVENRGEGLSWRWNGFTYGRLTRTGEVYTPTDPGYNSLALIADNARRRFTDTTAPRPAIDRLADMRPHEQILADRDVLVRAARAEGEPVESIARTMGVSRGRIYQILGEDE